MSLDHIGELPEVRRYLDDGKHDFMLHGGFGIRYVRESVIAAALAAADREVGRLRGEATDILDAIFQTVDPEEGEDIVAEAFPKGGPQWVLSWYREHPTDEDLAREGCE